ncbi:MAG: anti-sigma factor [Actinomycetota bacterium]|nr:anti-sigma factor [Actinomycetota bacterium]
MIDRHVEAQLLAGYVLQSLSGEDAAEADRLLAEHVPGCSECRLMLDAFQGVAGELALDAEPVTPPDQLLPRIHREMETQSRSGARWTPGRLVAAAASVVLVVGVGGLVLTQLGDRKTAQVSAADVQELADFAIHHKTQAQTLGGNAQEISARGVQELYVYGRGVPVPAPGFVYRLWAVSAKDATHLRDFLPYPDGTVLVRLAVDPSTFDHLLVTVEPADSQPSEPGEPAWPEAG